MGKGRLIKCFPAFGKAGVPCSAEAMLWDGANHISPAPELASSFTWRWCALVLLKYLAKRQPWHLLTQHVVLTDQKPVVFKLPLNINSAVRH